MNKEKKIIVIIGTRAQLIKTAPFIKELEKTKTPFSFIFTGQHSDTIDDLLTEFKISKPTLNLQEKFEADTLGKGFFWLIKTIYYFIFKKSQIFSNLDKKSIIITHGDTTTTCLVALFSKLYGYRVAHLESGLRSFNIFNPFPEEINRIITFCFSDIYLCPNEWALNNLKNYRGKKINTKGNTLIDSLKIALATTAIPEIHDKKFALVSIHRFENLFFKSRFLELINEIQKLSTKIKIKFVLHPVTEKILKKRNLFESLKGNPNIELSPRMGYSKFMQTLKNSEYMISDGGSNQEECSYLGTPCLLMRKKTERIEGLDSNIVISKFDTKIIEDFHLNHKKYRKEINLATESPSSISLESLKLILNEK